jgi:hypothetical protein
VLVEGRTDVSRAAARVEQVAEVHRAQLALVPLGQQDGVDRPADDAGFDERARVQPDDHGAVDANRSRSSRDCASTGLSPQSDVTERRQVEASHSAGVRGEAG